MPKGPKGEMHPREVIGNAVRVMRIATAQRLAKTLVTKSGGRYPPGPGEPRPEKTPPLPPGKYL